MALTRTPLSDAAIESLRQKKDSTGADGKPRTWLDVAGELGISDDHLYLILRKKRGPGGVLAVRLSSYLQMDSDQLFISPNS